jgi:hypothetical protein
MHLVPLYSAVMDEASPALRAVRQERRDVEKELRSVLTKKAAFMAQKNFAGKGGRVLSGGDRESYSSLRCTRTVAL